MLPQRLISLSLCIEHTQVARSGIHMPARAGFCLYTPVSRLRFQYARLLRLLDRSSGWSAGLCCILSSQPEVSECICEQTGNPSPSHAFRRDQQHLAGVVPDEQQPHGQVRALVNRTPPPEDPALGLQPTPELPGEVRIQRAAFCCVSGNEFAEGKAEAKRFISQIMLGLLLPDTSSQLSFLWAVVTIALNRNVLCFEHECIQRPTH